MIRQLSWLALVTVAFSACKRDDAPEPSKRDEVRPPSLVAARAGFHTRLVARPVSHDPPAPPPAGTFQLVHFDARPGRLAAYVTPDPGDHVRHPAIVWIHGGDSSMIGDEWSPQPQENDQSAAQYHAAGLVAMFPSLRGGNDNPGEKEGFLGEVDDVLAAAAYVKTLPYVDPDRVYLGGHSTGGTLALLVAEAAPPAVFREVFAFGPVGDVREYGRSSELCPFDMSDKREVALRSPARWLGAIQIRTHVIEGTGLGNIESVRSMSKRSHNPRVSFVPIEGASHFTILAPVNALIASRLASGAAEVPDADIARAMAH